MHKGKKYKPVKSNKQVEAVRRCNRAHDYYRLAELIASFVRKQRYKNYLSITDRLLHQYKGDHQLYCRIRDLKPPEKKQEYCTYEDRSYVSQNYARFIREVAPNMEFHIGNYLDFGCGTGAKSMNIAKQLEIPPDQTHGVDVGEWSVLDDETSRAIPNMHYVKPGEALPLKDGQFALVSAFSVLHHVREVKFVVAELVRCLAPGGYLIIREHHVEDDIDQMIIEIQHRIFDYIKIPDFQKNTPPDYIKGRSASEWQELFTSAGLISVGSETDWYHGHTQEPTKLFHAIFQKPS